MAIDTIRRSTLKLMALGASAAMAPCMAVAACKHSNSNHAMTSTTIRGTGLTINFGEKPGIDGSRQVIVINSNDQPVTLSQVYPGIVSTSDGQYDLNSLLVNGSREFAAKHATTLTINVARSDQLDKYRPPIKQSFRTADSLIRVRTTNANVNGGQPVTTIRQLFS